MKRVLVIGCPGSGKSTFARALHKKTGLPLHYLDLLFWNVDKTFVSREVFWEKVEKILVQDAWILDGNFGSSLEGRLKACDTVFFLDYPTEVCLAGVEARRGMVRPDLPWIEEEEDKEFTAYIKAFPKEQRVRMLEILEKYPEKTLIRFETRTQAEEYLANMK